MKKEIKTFFEEIVKPLTKYKPRFLKVVLSSIIIWIFILLVIYFVLGADYFVASMIPGLLISFEMSCFFNVIAFICKIFIKRIRKQNQSFRIELNTLKEQLGKVAK